MATLGTTAQLRARLRRRLGYVTDTVLAPDDLMDDCLDEALRTVNKYWPLYGVGSFVTVADQQVYSPLPAGGRRLIDVFWQDSATALSECYPAAYYQGGAGIGFSAVATALGPLFSGPTISEDGIRYTVQPSALAILQRHRSYIEAYSGQSSIITDRDTVYLDPRPTTAGEDVYFVYTADRYATIEDVTDDYAEAADAFWARALMVGHEALSVGRGAIDQVQGPDGRNVKSSAAKRHFEAAKMSKERLDEQTAVAPSPWIPILNPI